MSCVATPTLTRTDVVTTNNLVTSFTPSVSTQPGQVVTSFEVVNCGPAGPNVTLTCVPTSIPHVITIPGTVTTVQVPVVVTVPVTSNQITTLYGSSCAQVTNPSNPPSPPSSTISSVLTTSTPPPLIITSRSSSTLADGSVTVLVLTSTSTLPPSAVFVSTSVPNTNQSSTSTPSHSTNLGAIIGGVVGGLFGLIGIIVLIWFILKRRRRWDDIFDNDDTITATPHRDPSQRFDLAADVEPKPYQYGLVGQVGSPPLMSPPTSPPLTSTVPLGDDSAAAYSQHGRHRSSITPLNLSPPSTAGSNQPLRPLSGHDQRSSSPYTHSQSASLTSPPLTLGGWNTGPNFSVGSGSEGGTDDSQFNRSASSGMQEQQRRLQIVNASAGSSGDVNMPLSNDFGGKGQPLRNPSVQPVIVHVDSAAPAAPPAYEA